MSIIINSSNTIPGNLKKNFSVSIRCSSECQRKIQHQGLGRRQEPLIVEGTKQSLDQIHPCIFGNGWKLLDMFPYALGEMEITPALFNRGKYFVESIDACNLEVCENGLRSKC